MQLAVLDAQNPQFPDPNTALEDPDGLLAAGGNLEPKTLLSAYYQGIFPWYSQGDPLLWWSPSVRCLIKPEELHISKSLKKMIRQKDFTISFDQSFEAVITACSRADTDQETWIDQEMIDAYSELHQLGHAHSVEVWRDNKLIGGAYGVAIGAVFCGESMFSRQPSSSKIALAYLSKRLIKLGFNWIDCQLETDHLLSMGAQLLSRNKFLQLLQNNRNHRIEWQNAQAY
ncbi:MAG: leucyl/phenylalanyl-tRNA--protein transferase [Porticoccaceae bacterium]